MTRLLSAFGAEREGGPLLSETEIADWKAEFGITEEVVKSFGGSKQTLGSQSPLKSE